MTDISVTMEYILTFNKMKTHKCSMEVYLASKEYCKNPLFEENKEYEFLI